MSKWTYKKGNLRSSDFARIVLTDTAPYELPIILSNFGFYRNLKNRNLPGGPAALLDALIVNSRAKFTIPYRYNVHKDANSVRRLSLPHPAAQYDVVKFYENNSSLIVYYCSVGRFSIRSPFKVGSNYYYENKNSGLNKYKRDGIDTEDTDLMVKHPSSYFAYSGYDRLYKFYNSDEFVNLEKKFPVMFLADISKCFHSIYTHSISWAVKGMEHAKEHLSSSTFSDDFDSLMQRMNYNETNGICIGPEASRIFAEIILQRVDKNIATHLEKSGLIKGAAYEIRRYVDDYIIFAQTDDAAQRIVKSIQACLQAYNLHLNDAKLLTFARPFITPKSYIVASVKRHLDEFFERILCRSEGGKIIPRQIHRPNKELKGLLSNIKASCYQEKVDYDLVSNYVISSLAKRVDSAINDYEGDFDKHYNYQSEYQNLFSCLMEGIFFFFSVDPTPTSSYHVARAIITVMRFCEEKLPDLVPALAGLVHMLIVTFIKSTTQSFRSSGFTRVPVEVLNMLLAMAELPEPHQIDEAWILDNLCQPETMDYFTSISLLYYCGNRDSFKNVKRTVIVCIEEMAARDGFDVTAKSHDAHFALDLLSCPYLGVTLRRKIYRGILRALSLPAKLSNADVDIALGQFVDNPWFVAWKQMDILNIIEKKELSSVY